MTNRHLLARLEGMQRMLMGAHAAGEPMASASKGSEREAFLNAFLADVLPPQLRFGTGDATDQDGNKSGQLDIVVEYPFVPSLPLVAGRSPRLYLAEGIVAVIEVKSNLESQWDEVVATSQKLDILTRTFGTGVTFGPVAGPKIPLYAVGYAGWKKLSTLETKLTENPSVSGLLVIEHGNFAGHYKFIDSKSINDNNPTEAKFTYRKENSPLALWGLISCIHHAASMVTSTTKDVPRQYDKLDG